MLHRTEIEYFEFATMAELSDCTAKLAKVVGTDLLPTGLSAKNLLNSFANIQMKRIHGKRTDDTLSLEFTIDEIRVTFIGDFASIVISLDLDHWMQESGSQIIISMRSEEAVAGNPMYEKLTRFVCGQRDWTLPQFAEYWILGTGNPAPDWCQVVG
jgi:hypothetical protein